MYFAYLVTNTCRIMLGMLILLAFLRQLLPLVGKRPHVWEEVVCKITAPLWLLADCLCKMAGLPVEYGGIEVRYPIIVMMTAFAWLALAGS